MSLFRRSNEPIIFSVFADEKELEDLEIIIVLNGGAVCRNDPYARIKFTQYENYSNDIWPGAIVYDVNFIRQCVRQFKIVDPEPYRLSTKLNFDECLMSHFLFGYCECRRIPNAPASVTQPTTSGSLNEFFTPPTHFSELSIPNRSGTAETLESQLNSCTDQLSSIKSSDCSPSTLSPSKKYQLSSLTRVTSPNNRQHNSSNSSMKTNGTGKTVAPSIDNVDTLNTSSPIDESQPVVRFPHVINRVLPSGDSDSAHIIDDNEKRPCSVEYQRQVEPKLQMLDRLRKKQQRTATTLSNGSDASAIAASKISSGNLDRITKVIEPCECAKASSVVDPTNTEVEKKMLSPSMSEASTSIGNYSPQRVANVRKHLNSKTIKTLPERPRDSPQSAPEDDHSINKHSKCNNRKRQWLRENLESNPSPTKHSNSSIKNSEANSKLNSGEVKLSASKVINPFFKKERRILKNLFTTKFKPRIPIKEEENCEAILISRVPSQRKEQSSSNSAQNNDNENSTSHCNNADRDEPGPSRNTKPRRTLTQADILSSASSSDEQLADRLDPINERKSSKLRNKNRKIHKAENQERIQMISDACNKLNDQKSRDNSSVCTSDEQETSTDSDETNSIKSLVRLKRKRRARSPSEIETSVKRHKRSENVNGQHLNEPVKIIEKNRTTVDPKTVIILSSGNDSSGRSSTSGRIKLKTTDNCNDRSAYSNKNRAPNVDRTDSVSSDNSETHDATISHKSTIGNKATQNGNNKRCHNDNKEINEKQSPLKRNTKPREIVYPVSSDSDFSDSCNSEHIAARVESASNKTSQSQGRSETNRENVNHRKTTNRATESALLGRNSNIICETIEDLVNQSKLDVTSVKLANKDPILINKAHELNLLVQDSETEDENDDDDDNTRTTSNQNHNRDKTIKNSSNKKERDNGNATIRRLETVTRTGSKKTKNSTSSGVVGTNTSIESSSERIKNSCFHRNRDAIVDTNQTVNIASATSEDSDSSLSFSEVAAHSTMRSKQISKSTPKESENNHSTDHQRDKDQPRSSFDDQPPINRDRILDNRKLYTTSETNEIIKYLVKTNSIQLARGRKIFEEMSNCKKLKHRSATSLYNRFQKMLPDINKLTASLNLRREIREEFKKLKQRRYS